MKNALVTGASRGIGRAIALKLAKDGYNVGIHYNRSEKEARELATEVEKLGVRAFLFSSDVSKEDELIEMFKHVKLKMTKLNLLVNNVGFDYGKLIEDYSFEEMRYVIDVVLFSKIVATKLALPMLRSSESPCIINIASRMGKEKTIPTIGAYGPAEAGVIKWTQSCALEFAKDKIRVNCVAPGLTRTDLTKSILSDSDFDLAAEANPRGRVAEPDDIANLVSFIASDAADYINGETIGINGGSNLG